MKPPHPSNALERNLVALNKRIEDACARANRSSAELQLIAVSKTRSINEVRHAHTLGLNHFGENYLDEAINKITATADLGATWHFIGRIQSNKTRLIAEHFQWVHTVDRHKIAQRLDQQCPPGKRLNVLVQINIDADPNKGGISPETAEDLLTSISTMPNLVPRGLMTILAQDQPPGNSYRAMAQLAHKLAPVIQDRLRELGSADNAQWGTLSMGMSADLEDAIAAGATQIRIGTALFGPRAPLRKK